MAIIIKVTLAYDSVCAMLLKHVLTKEKYWNSLSMFPIKISFQPLLLQPTLG